MKIGIVAFSFGLTDDEPSRVNKRLAQEVERIAQEERKGGNDPLMVLQWEVASAIRPPSPAIPSRVVWPKKGMYLDSDEVMRQAAKEFRSQGVEHIIAVANPAVLQRHLRFARGLIRRHGFHVVKRKIGDVGFCPRSSQWQDRGPIQLLTYAVIRKLFHYRQRPASKG